MTRISQRPRQGSHRAPYAATVSSPVPETSNPLTGPFLALWPHRFDYLYADHPKPGSRPEWMTESRHPLADRIILQGSYLYGVRFGPETCYGLLDIDKGSPYHPRRDPLALERICAALEPLGLVDHLTVTSSDSKGLHVYFPFEAALPSWKLALVIATLLENTGFKIMPGWLEVFPNPKPFSSDGTISLYNGHRLPMQQGSYLLNEDLQPVHSSEQTFARRWRTLRHKNCIDEQTLTRIVKQAKRKTYRVTGKAEKFINDLNAEIESGWTGKSQTNKLIGRITMRSYIFGHVLYAAAPLTGEALIKDIVRVAKALPGYTDYCGHQHEIEKCVRNWVRSVEKSHYFPYGNDKPKVENNEPSWNEQQRLAARERIRDAVVALFKANAWPEGATARFDAIRVTGISGTTLYKNKDLWHPQVLAVESAEALQQEQTVAPVDNPPDPPISQAGVAGECALGAPLTPYGPNLLQGLGCNPLEGRDSSRLLLSENGFAEGGVRNIDDIQDSLLSNEAFAPPPQQLILNIKQMLQEAQRSQQEKRQQNDEQEIGKRRKGNDSMKQLQAWAASNDPILKAEALRQLARLGHQVEGDGI